MLRERGLRLTPRDEQSWVARGLARMDRDPKGAIADFDEKDGHPLRYIRSVTASRERTEIVMTAFKVLSIQQEYQAKDHRQDESTYYQQMTRVTARREMRS